MLACPCWNLCHSTVAFHAIHKASGTFPKALCYEEKCLTPMTQHLHHACLGGGGSGSAPQVDAILYPRQHHPVFFHPGRIQSASSERAWQCEPKHQHGGHSCESHFESVIEIWNDTVSTVKEHPGLHGGIQHSLSGGSEQCNITSSQLRLKAHLEASWDLFLLTEQSTLKQIHLLDQMKTFRFSCVSPCEFESPCSHPPSLCAQELPSPVLSPEGSTNAPSATKTGFKRDLEPRERACLLRHRNRFPVVYGRNGDL